MTALALALHILGAVVWVGLAIAVALGLPPPDQWLQLLYEAREAVLALRTSS